MTLEVVDGGRRIACSFADVLDYHGPGSPGGAAVAFKVLERALPLLDPHAPCERRELTVETAFGGPGARDAFELVTRAVSGDRYRVDPGLARPDRGRALERFVFRLGYRGRVATLALRPGFVPDEFIDLARTDPRSAAQERRLDALKLELAERVLARPAAEVVDAALERPFGTTGLTVPPLGLGTGQIGEADVDDARAARVLHAAVDAGVRLIDTARGYGTSEERIGRHLGGRRGEVVLVTKVGYDVEGAADWTAAAVTGGIERALRMLRTDVLDVALLHSCPRATLERGEVIEALLAARDAGRIRVAGYSGENDALAWAVRSGHFGAVETSVSLADQWSLANVLPDAGALGVIAKRPLANAPWRFPDRPAGHYAEAYWDRLHALGLEPADGDWAGTAARFAAYAPGVSAAIVGTASVDHLQAAAAAVARGPLPADEVARWRVAFAPHAAEWRGEL